MFSGYILQKNLNPVEIYKKSPGYIDLSKEWKAVFRIIAGSESKYWNKRPWQKNNLSILGLGHLIKSPEIVYAKIARQMML